MSSMPPRAPRTADAWGERTRPDASTPLVPAELAELAGRLILCDSWNDAWRWTAGILQRLLPGLPISLVAWEPQVVTAMTTRDAANVVPVVARGAFVGAIEYNPQPEQRQHAAALIGAAARLLGRFAQAHAERCDLRERAIRDPLTNLFNRGHFEAQLGIEISRARRNAVPLGLILFDVDAFKRFNTDHGYATGDSVLKRIAPVLRDGVRTSDIVCRLGGDELAVILWNASPTTSNRRAEALLDAVREATPAELLRVGHRVTATGGVANFPQHADGAEDLVACADHALRRGKRGGGNAVWSFDPETPDMSERVETPLPKMPESVIRPQVRLAGARSMRRRLRPAS